MDRCCIHYDKVEESKLVTLSTLDSWTTLLNAAKKRSYSPLLKVSDETPSGTIPSLVYHKTCRSMFTLKRDLQQSTSNEKTRSSNRGEGSQILP